MPRTVACQAPLSMGFSKQEHWSGLPCPSPGDLPDPGIEPAALKPPALSGRFFTTRATWEAQQLLAQSNKATVYINTSNGKFLRSLMNIYISTHTHIYIECFVPGTG